AEPQRGDPSAGADQRGQVHRAAEPEEGGGAEADVAGARTVVPELVDSERPDLVLVNDDDLTYCKLRFDERSLATLREHLGDITDPLARALCWSALWNLTRDGLLPAREYLAMVRRFAGAESDIGVLQMLQAWADAALTHYTAPDGREEAGRLLAAAALEELRRAEPGSGHQLAWTRFFAQLAADEAELALLRGLLEGTEKIDGLDVDQELRWAFLATLASRGAADEDAIAAELARDDTASGRRHQVRCLAARPSAEVKAGAWASVVESEELSNALVEATISGFDQPGQRELLAPYAPRYFEVVERIWRERSIEIAMSVVRGLFPALQDSRETLEATDAWLAGHADAAPALRRLVLEARDDLARSLRAQARDASAV
ncbi:ERAP1-like C-terminal domain-containing protein, partial [Streptomyces sp. NPDC049577]|uniref:ERAP1-like C-terminal domain-containing protein n=1 Tax=Streptomyces sp. NPDC049577 TaxID=3155153 RepID=UPI0034497099